MAVRPPTPTHSAHAHASTKTHPLKTRVFHHWRTLSLYNRYHLAPATSVVFGLEKVQFLLYSLGYRSFWRPPRCQHIQTSCFASLSTHRPFVPTVPLQLFYTVRWLGWMQTSRRTLPGLWKSVRITEASV